MEWAIQSTFLGMQDDSNLNCLILAGQLSRERQRKGRYNQGDPNRHPATMLPELARALLQRYSAPGERILVPTAGIGTELVEACWLGIDGVGIELDAQWLRQARWNLAHNFALGAPGKALLVQGDAREIATLVDGRFDGALWSPPYASMLRQHPAARDRKAREARMAATGYEIRPVTMGGPRSQTSQGTYGSNHKQSHLGYMTPEEYRRAVTQIMEQLHQVVKPGGWQAVVVRDIRLDGRPVLLLNWMIEAAEAAGWVYQHRRTALLFRVDGEGIIHERASWFQRLESRQTGHPIPVTEDIVVFERP